MFRSLDGGSVRVAAARLDDRLHITVDDDGPGDGGSESSFGIGLANTRERLMLDGFAMPSRVRSIRLIAMCSNS